MLALSSLGSSLCFLECFVRLHTSYAIVQTHRCLEWREVDMRHKSWRWEGREPPGQASHTSEDLHMCAMLCLSGGCCLWGGRKESSRVLPGSQTSAISVPVIFTGAFTLPSHAPIASLSPSLSALTGRLCPTAGTSVSANLAATVGADVCEGREGIGRGSGDTCFCVSDRKSTRLNSSHSGESRMPSSA